MDIVSHSQRKQPLHRRAYTQIKNNKSQLPQTAGENLFSTTQTGDGFIGGNPWQGGLTELDTASLNIGSPFVPRGQANEGQQPLLSEVGAAVPARVAPSQLEPLHVETGSSKACKALHALAGKNFAVRSNAYGATADEEATNPSSDAAGMVTGISPSDADAISPQPASYARGSSFTQNRIQFLDDLSRTKPVTAISGTRSTLKSNSRRTNGGPRSGDGGSYMSNTARNTKNNNFYIHNNTTGGGGAHYQHIFAKS